ncbi:hypothetical protein PLICRDRAFT_386588 [Plicaturopsis crispa FD-325 SS-3]|nr:hypothetical protein PLICRDRAFT_386588 [Plicaturopsis crispa FD-325 SS-3]
MRQGIRSSTFALVASLSGANVRSDRSSSGCRMASSCLPHCESPQALEYNLLTFLQVSGYAHQRSSARSSHIARTRRRHGRRRLEKDCVPTDRIPSKRVQT